MVTNCGEGLLASSEQVRDAGARPSMKAQDSPVAKDQPRLRVTSAEVRNWSQGLISLIQKTR